MTLLLLACVASAIFGIGWAVGFALGRQAGTEDAYGAVEAYRAAQERKDKARRRIEEQW